MTRTVAYIFILSCFLAHSACDIINPEEDIPAFVYIEPFTFEGTPDQGTADQTLPYVEILSGTDNLGTHFLPSRIPLLLEGTHTLDLFPGISENGISSFPAIYNMMEFDPVTVDLVPTEVDTIQPVARYKENLVFAIQEPFESALQLFREDLDGDTFTKINLTSEGAFEGNSSGKATINKEHPILEVVSDRIAEFPPRSTIVYMEMNYRTEAEFSVGVYWTTSDGIRSSSVINFINPKDEWNKIYFNFSEIFDFLTSQGGVTDWQIGINARMPIDDNGEFIDEERNIWLDNIKLIHFEL